MKDSNARTRMGSSNWAVHSLLKTEAPRSGGLSGGEFHWSSRLKPVCHQPDSAEDPYLTASSSHRALVNPPYQRLDSRPNWIYSLRLLRWLLKGCGSIGQIGPSRSKRVDLSVRSGRCAGDGNSTQIIWASLLLAALLLMRRLAGDAILPCCLKLKFLGEGFMVRTARWEASGPKVLVESSAGAFVVLLAVGSPEVFPENLPFRELKGVLHTQAESKFDWSWIRTTDSVRTHNLCDTKLKKQPFNFWKTKLSKFANEKSASSKAGR